MTRQDLDELAARVLEWRRRRAPRTRDDITRLVRPKGWVPDWSKDAVRADRAALLSYESEHARLVREEDSHSDRRLGVDVRILGSVLARVRFELDILRCYERDAWFYLDHTMGLVFDDLLSPPPFANERVLQLVSHLRSFRQTLEVSRSHLSRAGVVEFAELALEASADAPGQLREAISALVEVVDPSFRDLLEADASGASAALADWRRWLEKQKSGFRAWEPIGENGLAFFLSSVALIARSPDELVSSARHERDRAVAFELFEAHRQPLDEIAASIAPDEQVRREEAAELEVRAFYEAHDLLSQPEHLAHYRNMVRPCYLEPLSWLGVTDDLTDPRRLGEDGVSYVPSGTGPLPYFYRANALDPRLGIVHEGAHYQQLVLSWAAGDALRSGYIDSAANEGIAFYNEEMMLEAGLFADAPSSRAAIYNFMRLRALRVELDVGLALGRLTIDEAAEALARKVPMDSETARAEAAFFAATPGQGLSYQTGKAQVLSLLSECREKEGDSFSLREWHDWLWRNGNVPLSLLRFERLGLRDELDCLDRTASRLRSRLPRAGDEASP